MKISEKQIQCLIYYITLITSNENVSLTKETMGRACNLLTEIANQQSDELKDVE